MTLVIGTDEGVFRAADLPVGADGVEPVLDCGSVTAVRRFEHASEVYVAAASGAYRSADGGRTWEDLGVPAGDRYWYSGDREVWSVLAAADGTLYAGTNDPVLYRSTDDGETWAELRGFRTLPSRGAWESPRDPHRARLRVLEPIPGRRGHLLAGIEAGGIHVSTDAGETWTDRRAESPTDDIHQVLPLDPDVWLAVTGYLDLHFEHLGFGHAVGPGGLYRTRDGGETWTRLDAGSEHAYIRRVFVHDGTLFYCGATEAPPAWAAGDHEAALFESTDFGRTAERVPYPGAPHEVIDAWTVHDGAVVCGAGRYTDAADDEPRGRIIRREEDGGDLEYRTVGRVPGIVSALEAV